MKGQKRCMRKQLDKGRGKGLDNMRVRNRVCSKRAKREIRR